MNKNFKLFTPIIIILMGLSVVLTAITLLFNTWLFIICSLISAAVFALVLFMISSANRKVSKTLQELSEGVLYANSNVFSESNIPAIAVYEGGEIIWYNSACEQDVFEYKDYRGEHIGQVFPDLDVTESTDSLGTDVSFAEKDYTAFVTMGNRENRKITVIYLVDDTELKYYTHEYQETRLSVAIVLVDSYDEVLQDFKEVERAQIVSQIENAIDKYFNKYNGYVIRVEKDKFVAIVEERGVQAIVERKFDILDTVRSIDIGDRSISATLSIGLGHGADSIIDSEAMAQQALDMCLGRGGDQAAIRNEDGYEFFGGVSSGVEKRTKVRTRIIASAMAELVEASSNVIIMGHRFADLDALGSAVGMLKAVREMKKPSFICIDQEKNMVDALLTRLKEGGYNDNDFRSPERALKAINNNTLLIIVDAHVPDVLQSQEIYKACKNVVVIDHHRKLVGYINNAVIFYHEPYASSASEMVTELIQYFPVDPKIGKLEAEALLAGITLDTKNFIMRTGVRTFEAAAWLRRMGADTIEVKKMFSSSMESYRKKAGIVSKAVNYKNCAIAVENDQFEGIRVIASQAADDLMNISGINASFVMFPYDSIVNVSARSIGAVNVQVIMEKLGGGGHHTMAAAQFSDQTTENVEQMLKKAIDEYYTSLPDDIREELHQPLPADGTKDLVDESTVLEGQVLMDVKEVSEEKKNIV